MGAIHSKILHAEPYSLFQLRFLPRIHVLQSAVMGITIVSRPYVRLSATLMYRGRMCWLSSKLITRMISFGSFSRSHNIGH